MGDVIVRVVEVMAGNAVDVGFGFLLMGSGAFLAGIGALFGCVGVSSLVDSVRAEGEEPEVELVEEK